MKRHVVSRFFSAFQTIENMGFLPTDSATCGGFVAKNASGAAFPNRRNTVRLLEVRDFSDGVVAGFVARENWAHGPEHAIPTQNQMQSGQLSVPAQHTEYDAYVKCSGVCRSQTLAGPEREDLLIPGNRGNLVVRRFAICRAICPSKRRTNLRRLRRLWR